jgi:hypothetical protein
VAPYCVLFKPSHGKRILSSEAGAGFSPKAAYIFKKQLEEADAIVLNRIDELDPDAVEELAGLVQESFPGTPLLRMSARTGAGFEALAEFLDQEGDFGRRVLDIDYDTYAEGEAELGWLNSSIRVEATTPFALDALLLDVIVLLRAALVGTGGEVAHLKAIGLGPVSFGVANLTSSEGEAELSLPSQAEVTEFDLIVNARVAIDPATIEREVRLVVESATAARGARTTFHTMQSFRPGRPVPTHRRV